MNSEQDNMEPTRKLYFTDSNLLQFTAKVLEVKSSEAGDQIVLDQTAFYPTGGGQPNDTGSLGDLKVVDVFEDEAGVIHHVTNEHSDVRVGESLDGKIDFERRRDHLQQHSGQHILSQAFVQACGAQTRSFHLGAETSTIDIELNSPTDDSMRAAEEVANAIIFEDRPMRVHLLTEEEAAKLPLRKESAVRGNIRVIEVEDFDWSPCGGTHASRTGQIGLIAIKSFERAKKMTRVEFVCGHRALEEYRRVRSVAVSVAAQFSAALDQAPELVTRSLQETKSLKKRIRELLELATKAEAQELLAAADPSRGFKLVQATFEGRDAEELRMLATKIVQSESAIALLGSKEADAARLVFARSQSLGQNMGQLLSEACHLLGGRGGGRPDMAQGGGPNVARLEEALKLASEELTQND